MPNRPKFNDPAYLELMKHTTKYQRFWRNHKNDPEFRQKDLDESLNWQKNNHDKFLARQRSYDAERREFLKSQSCFCCGSNEKITFDHIIPIQRQKHSGLSTAMMFREYKKNPSAFQFLCKSCNCSKHDGSICHIHRKYLGIWNYLPKLDDLDA